MPQPVQESHFMPMMLETPEKHAVEQGGISAKDADLADLLAAVF